MMSYSKSNHAQEYNKRTKNLKLLCKPDNPFYLRALEIPASDLAGKLGISALKACIPNRKHEIVRTVYEEDERDLVFSSSVLITCKGFQLQTQHQGVVELCSFIQWYLSQQNRQGNSES